MPTDQPFVAAATADVSVSAGENMTVIGYTWSHPDDGVQDGLLAIGPAEEPDKVVAIWGDSWHQAPAAKQLAGDVAGRVVTVGYIYAEEWEWRITLDASSSESLLLRMDNVVPQSAAAEGHAAGAYWAMESELARGQ
jgi:hypothetical protein